MHKSNCRDASRVSPLHSVSTVASSPRMDLVKNYRVQKTHWLISTQVQPTVVTPTVVQGAVVTGTVVQGEIQREY